MHSRRKVLKLSAGLVGASTVPAILHAASSDEVGINAPRLALVIGNSSYQNSPLENPVNDATAISKTLADLGFQCQLLTNAKLRDMAAAIHTHGEKLARLKAVGLFYYAGHGAQLAWRNYLVPVDASIAKLEDLPQQTLELNSLLLSLKKAANPMNVIILDACRDNPFGSRVPLEQKGLSQFDAPIGSLLSYATAPGNTASDGEGANGLFTENLLREMRVPGAKLEDVFKRVRLQVRLKSNGKQIPWESTSLEEDFYFSLNPEQLRKISNDQKASAFAEELSIWTAIKESTSVDSLLTYLIRFPNGNFSQLAQAKLDRLLIRQGEKKVEISTSVSNPFTKGTRSAIGQYQIGDSYTFEQRDAISNGVERIYQESVTNVNDTEIVFNNGLLVLDKLGNEVKSQIPRILTPAQLFPLEYSVGAKWQTQFGWMFGNGFTRSVMTANMKVVDRQPYRSPLGSFNAYKVIGEAQVSGGDLFEIIYWIDPEKCNRPLQFELLQRSGRIRVALRNVLTGFSQKPAQSSG